MGSGGLEFKPDVVIGIGVPVAAGVFVARGSRRAVCRIGGAAVYQTADVDGTFVKIIGNIVIRQAKCEGSPVAAVFVVHRNIIPVAHGQRVDHLHFHVVAVVGVARALDFRGAVAFPQRHVDALDGSLAAPAVDGHFHMSGGGLEFKPDVVIGTGVPVAAGVFVACGSNSSVSCISRATVNQATDIDGIGIIIIRRLSFQHQ